MYLDISPGDVDRTNRIGGKDKNSKPIMVRGQRQVFSNKKRLKGKGMPITENLTELRMTAMNEKRNQFGYKNVWTAGGKIIYQVEGEAKG